MITNLLAEMNKMHAAILLLRELAEDGNANEDQFFRKLFDQRQRLISSELIESVSFLVTAGFPADCRARLLELIARYSAVTKMKKENQRTAYMLLWEDSLQVSRLDDPLQSFLLVNYAFLTARNAKQWTAAEDIYPEVLKSAQQLPECQRAEQLGYVYYNMARHLLDNMNKPEEAMQLYINAGHSRIAYLEMLKHTGKSDEATLLAAAQQVAKIREDWPVYFGLDTIEQCPVSAEYQESLIQTFGRDVLRFSATR